MTARLRYAALASVSLAIVLCSRGASADDARLIEARHHYEELDYEKCLSTLAQPPPATSTDVERADRDILTGVCHFELGHPTEGLDWFRRGLRINLHSLLPPYSSPKIVNAFASAQTDVRAEAGAALVPVAPTMPAPSTAVTIDVRAPRDVSPPARMDPRHHGPPLTSILLASGALAFGAVGTYGYVRAHALEADANGAHFESDAISLGDRAKGSIVVANVGLVGAIVLAATAVVVWLASER